MSSLLDSSTRLHTSCGRLSSSVGGTAGNIARLSATAPRSVQTKRKVVHCIAETVVDLAASRRSSGKNTSSAPQRTSQQERAFQRQSNLAGQQLKAASTGAISSTTQALEVALSSLEDSRNMQRIVAESGADDSVQQHFQALVEAQQHLVACLQQHHQQEGATQSSVAAPAESESNDGTALPAEQNGLPLSMAESSSSTAVMSAAASLGEYPVITERVADVYESQLGLHPQPLVLDSPSTSDDESTAQQLTGVWAGVAAGRGQRRYMEDVSAINWLHPDQGVLPNSDHTIASTLIAGVYDGHGGRNTAAYAAAQFPLLLHNELLSSGRNSKAAAVDNQQVLSKVYHQLDRNWAEQMNAEQSGSTAVTAFINRKNLVVANAGDSVAVLARGGTSRRLTHTHNLYCPKELARVTAAGGKVVQDRAGKPRLVQSPASVSKYVAARTLALSRAFGDYGFKGIGGDLVISTPHVAELELSPDDELLLLASDGVTDVMADDDMIDIATKAISQARNNSNNGHDLAAAAAAAVKDAALGAGAYDNLTALAILLEWGR